MAAIRTGLSEQTGTARPAVPARTRRVARTEVEAPYLNRELAWLEFNARVLFEARDERNPLLERVKFLSIFAGNLDEFFQVRVAGLRQQVEAGKAALSPDGRTAEEQLEAARARVLELVGEHSAIYVDVRRSLAAEGIELVDYAAIPEHHEALRQRFLDEIFPVLTPLAVDPGHPFPYISTLSLSIAVGLRDPATGERGFARVKVPQILPRLIEIEKSRFVLIDQVIEANLDALFSGMEVLEHHLFRVTRNADFTIEEDEADDLLLAIEEELRRRRFGEAVRLEVERSMPAAHPDAAHARSRPRGGRLLRDQRHAGPRPACGASPTWTDRTSRSRSGHPSRRPGSSRRMTTNPPMSSRPSGPATSWSTTRTSRSPRRSSGSSPRPRTIRTS